MTAVERVKDTPWGKANGFFPGKFTAGSRKSRRFGEKMIFSFSIG